MTWNVYVLKSEKDARLYKGMTHDVELRVTQHNQGKVRPTKPYRPWKLVYTEECRDSSHAREREKFLKSPYGREFLKRKGL